MNSESLYVFFSNTGTLLSRIISNVTDDKYVHVSISFDNSFTQMYSFGRIFPSNPLIGGFVQENIYKGVFKNFEDSICLVYKIDITKEQKDNILRQISRFQESKTIYRYNFIGLLALKFNKQLNRDKHYFCSEFVSEILINSGVFTTDKSPQMIAPMDLIDIPNKSLFYEGYIHDLYRDIDIPEDKSIFERLTDYAANIF